MKQTFRSNSFTQQRPHHHHHHHHHQPIFHLMEPSFPHSLSSSSSPSFAPKPTLPITDVSSSFYLRPPSSDELQLKRSVSLSSQQEHAPKHAAADVMELSIFDAQKYFNEINDQLFTKGPHAIPPLVKEDLPDSSVHIPRLSSASSSVDGYGRNYRSRSFRSSATPTASSEASWNSHTGLLSNPPGATSVSLKDPEAGRKRGSNSPRWLLFQQKCPCLSKKSVQVKERSSQPRSPAHSISYRSKELVSSKVAREKAPAKDFAAAVAETHKESSINTSTPHGGNKMGKRLANPSSNTLRRFSSDMENQFPPTMRTSISAPGRPFIDAASAGFTFPVLNPSMSSSSPASPPMKLVPNGLSSSRISATVSPSLPLVVDPPRHSLEVFEPSDSSNILLVMPARPGPRENHGVDDEAASDASSDLFEIESFTTQSTSYPGIPHHRRRDSLDEARPRFSTNSGAAGAGLYACTADDQPMTPSSAAYASMECGYEPSEASIAWSVTTAEGTAWDRGSVTNYSVSASDVEEFTRLQLRLHQELERSGAADVNSSSNGGSSRRKGKVGLLTSCQCEKAVSVGPSPVRCMAEQGQHQDNNSNKIGSGRPNSFSSQSQSQSQPQPQPVVITANGRLSRHVSSSRPPLAPVANVGMNTPINATAHSARLSLSFAT